MNLVLPYEVFFFLWAQIIINGKARDFKFRR